MTARHPITPAPFDHHAEAIDGLPDPWPNDEPDEGVVDVFATPHPPIPAPRAVTEPYQERESRTTAFLVALGVGILVLLVLAVWMVTGWLAGL